MKKFYKLISLLLVGATLFNNFAPVVEALSSTNKTSKTNVVAVNDNEKTLIEVKGDIEIETKFVLPIRNSGTSDITLKVYDSKNNSTSVSLKDIEKAQGYIDKTIKLNGQEARLTANKRDKDGSFLTGVDKNNNIAYLAVNLYGVVKDTYKIELSGTNFVKYQTSVTLDNFSKRVEITNEKGMFEIGDVNQDNKVDASDEKLVLDAIETKNTKYDLNFDGVIDIADLNYITAILTGTTKKVGIENTNAIIDNSNVDLNVTDDTIIEGGALESIFNDEGTLTLKRNDNEKVSEENPISLTMDLGSSKEETIPMSEIRIATGDNAPQKLTAIVLDSKGKEHRIDWEKKADTIHSFTDRSDGDSIVIDLKGQVAVKKVTIVITETGSNNLADIAKVEFLNNVKVETKAPADLDVPKNIKVDTSVSEQLTVSFNSVPNVTGYEIRIYGPQKEGTNKAEPGVIFETTFTSFTIEDLKNYKTYSIWVRAVNKEWKSNWSGEEKATPEAKRLPPSVDMVNLTPLYSGLDISWKDMDDTESYNVYYRMVGEEKYQSVKNITGMKYTLKGLKDGVEYQVYITGNNKLGEGSPSQTVKAKTLKADATIVPQYKLINTESSDGTKSNHIKDVIPGIGTMTDNDKLSIVDDKFNTYWEYPSWHAGTHYSRDSRVPIVVLDNTYKMDEFVVTVPDSYPYTYKTYGVNEGDFLIHYWNDKTETFDNATRTSVKAIVTAKKDENGRTYYLMKTEDPITANAIQVGLTVTGNGPLAQISEIKLYEYDSLVDDVAALFTDDLRLVLSEGVTQTKINELRARADVKSNGEYNPYRDAILADLTYAEKILNDEDIKDVIKLNPKISNSYNGKTGFAMSINDYQPLGIVAKPKEKITVYVGTNAKSVNAEIVFTQYYAEADKWQTTYRSLVKGQNIIEVPQIGNAEAERGGSVYIRYTSMPDLNNPILIRVSGGTPIPVLDTTTLTTEQEKKTAIKNYITELDKYVTNLKSSSDYVERESVLDSTEIATRQGLLSVSAVAVKNALDTNLTTQDAKIERLYKSTEAFDEMIDFFYRQKGFETNAQNIENEMPSSRINIRYMRMFDGAFMYAGGYHIGIGYGSIAGLVQAESNSDLKTGYFGWGISHEVGHQINQGTLAIAEVTNNIYALLAQTSNDKDESRLENSGIYPKIYEKVTSSTAGKAQNVFVQLGMYWQLHLAYDNTKTFEDTNSIFARINRLARGYVNSENYSKDDLLVLFASEAAEKDLTEFFEAWGLRPTEKLKTYLKDELQLEKETRKIQYLNDDARRYRLANPNSIFAKDTTVDAEIVMVDNAKKEVTINFNLTKEKDKLLGYEILRNGEPIAFVLGSETSYVDRIGAENNRAYVYQVVAYDKLLNKTETVTLDEIKISYDGALASKDTLTIESNFKEEGEIVDLEDSRMDYTKLAVNKLIDSNNQTGFNGTTRIKTFNPNNTTMGTDNNNAYVIISLNDKYDISGIKYQALVNEDGSLAINTINEYKIYVSADKENWTLAKEGNFNLTKDNSSALVYFMKPGTDSENQLWTYNNVSYIKIVADGNNNGLSGSEIDLITPPGDNVDISYTTDNIPMVGRLESDYVYDESKGDDGIIKAGSVVIKGEYRGSPSFNVLTITDALDNTKVYPGYQLLFANINSDMTVYDVASGTWVFVMTKDEYEKLLKESTSIRVNLYRVNDAITNEGQRLTSTSKSIKDLPSYDSLKSMSINSSKLGE